MPSLELFDFDEYSDHLSPANNTKLHALAQEIQTARASANPVIAVAITGHSDQALRVPPAERQAFEMEVSVKRATAAAAAFRQVMAQTALGELILITLAITTAGRGSMQRVYENPVDDVERRRNRRVVIDCYRVQDTPVHPPTPLPRPDPNPDDDPNTVNAGQTFRIKLMYGAAVGEGGGAFAYTFIIWDTVNSRAAVYDYAGIAAMGGVSSPFSGESDWAEFTTQHPKQVDQLGGTASHSNITLPMSFMVLNLPDATVNLFIGPAVGLAVESGFGPLTYSVGSLKVFSGD
jgi:hypothetical protein